jgi:hypothetical protein
LDALLVPPLLPQLLQLDPRNRSVHFKGDNISVSLLSKFLRILRGDDLEIGRNKRDGFRSLAHALQNSELEILFFTTVFADDELVTRFTISSELASFADVLNFLAHLDLFSPSQMKCLSVETLDLILAYPSLRIQSEDNLLCRIEALGLGCAQLVEYVKVPYLSKFGF